MLSAWLMILLGLVTLIAGADILVRGAAWIAEALGETSFSLHQALKTTLDPTNTLNPGKFLDD